ncbi:transcriptional regulator, partial [Streptomyces sp. 900105245]
MGWWQLNADTLARSRFVVSPLAETFACLKLLHAGEGAHPGERDWLRAHLPGYRARSAADPVTALLVRALDPVGQFLVGEAVSAAGRDEEALGEDGG